MLEKEELQAVRFIRNCCINLFFFHIVYIAWISFCDLFFIFLVFFLINHTACKGSSVNVLIVNSS